MDHLKLHKAAQLFRTKYHSVFLTDSLSFASFHHLVLVDNPMLDWSSSYSSLWQDTPLRSFLENEHLNSVSFCTRTTKHPVFTILRFFCITSDDCSQLNWPSGLYWDFSRSLLEASRPSEVLYPLSSHSHKSPKDVGK